TVSCPITNTIVPDEPASDGQWDANFGQRSVALANSTNSLLLDPVSVSASDGLIAVRTAFHEMTSTDQTNWTDLGQPFDITDFGMMDLTLVDGTNLYVTGGTSSDPYHVYKWDSIDAQWVPVGDGLQSGSVEALAKIGGQLYVGGSFIASGTNVPDTTIKYI